MIQHRNHLIITFVLLVAAECATACPDDYRRLEETYNLREFSLSVDSFWLGNGHTFVVTFAAPPIHKSVVKVYFTDRSTRKLREKSAPLRPISDGLYRGFVFIPDTEMYGKGHVQIHGKFLGSEGKPKQIFKHDLKPFLPGLLGGCY